MIDDVLDIMRTEGRWMTAEEISDALKEMDPVRYRTAKREYVIRCICNLIEQGFIIDKEYFQDGYSRWARFHYVGIKGVEA